MLLNWDIKWNKIKRITKYTKQLQVKNQITLTKRKFTFVYLQKTKSLQVYNSESLMLFQTFYSVVFALLLHFWMQS